MFLIYSLLSLLLHYILLFHRFAVATFLFQFSRPWELWDHGIRLDYANHNVKLSLEKLSMSTLLSFSFDNPTFYNIPCSSGFKFVFDTIILMIRLFYAQLTCYTIDSKNMWHKLYANSVLVAHYWKYLITGKKYGAFIN